MESYELSNTQWDRIEGFLPGRQGWVGVTAKDNRDFVNGVLEVLRSGTQWKICSQSTETGKVSPSVSPAEPGPESGRGYSRCC